jgi:hypothetical protein
MKRNKILQSVIFNWPVKILSLVFAISLFLVVRYTTVDQRHIEIPLEVTYPKGYLAASTIPRTVELIISGDERVIHLIDPSAVEASVDFSFVDAQGVSGSPVLLNYGDFHLYGDISFTTEPGILKVFFKAVDASDTDGDPAENLGGIVL